VVHKDDREGTLDYQKAALKTFCREEVNETEIDRSVLSRKIYKWHGGNRFTPNTTCLICFKPSISVMCKKCLKRYLNSPRYSVRLTRTTDRLLKETGKQDEKP
jgi:hypothetical protein